MSNARNLSNLLGTGTTIATASIADDAITSAKIADNAITGALLPSGSVIQTVTNATTGSSGNKTNTSYEDVPNFTLTITPTSTSSKIYISASMYGFNNIVASTNVNMNVQLMRDSTILATMVCGCHTSSGGLRIRDSIAFAELDAQATTSAVTYKIQAETSNSSSAYNISSGEIIAMEIAG